MRKGRFVLSGFLHACLRNPAAPVRLKTRLDDPTVLAEEQLRMLHDVQESALTYQTVEVADRVSAEFVVVKIHPEPNPRTAVIEVEGAGFGITRDDKKHKQGLGELNPFRDRWMLGHFK